MGAQRSDGYAVGGGVWWGLCWILDTVCVWFVKRLWGVFEGEHRMMKLE